MGLYDVVLSCARHVITRVLNPRFLSSMTSYDVASTTHQSLLGGQPPGGGVRAADGAPAVPREAHGGVMHVETA